MLGRQSGELANELESRASEGYAMLSGDHVPRPFDWLIARIRRPTWGRYWAFAAVWVAFRALTNRETDPLLFWAHVALSVFVILIMGVVVWSDKQRPAKRAEVGQGGAPPIDTWMPALVGGVLVLGAIILALVASH